MVRMQFLFFFYKLFTLGMHFQLTLLCEIFAKKTTYTFFFFIHRQQSVPTRRVKMEAYVLTRSTSFIAYVKRDTMERYVKLI